MDINNIIGLPAFEAHLQEVWSSYIEGSKSAVQALVMEFNRKKQAWSYQTKSNYDSGEVDCELISQYRTTENIFRNDVKFRGGKRHGVIINIDFSGSMGSRIIESVCQAINVVRFCRQVGVAFEVYAANDGIAGMIYSNAKINYNEPRPVEQELLLLLSSSWSKSKLDFMTRALFYGIVTRQTFYKKGQSISSELSIESSRYHHFRSESSYSDRFTTSGNPTLDLFIKFQRNLKLGGSTTITSTTTYMVSYIPQWKAMNKLDEVSYILLSDGQDNRGNSTSNISGAKIVDQRSGFIVNGIDYMGLERITENSPRVSSIINMARDSAASLLAVQLELLRRRGIKTIGIFLTDQTGRRFRELFWIAEMIPVRSDYTNLFTSLFDKKSDWNENRAFAKNFFGYDDFYAMSIEGSVHFPGFVRSYQEANRTDSPKKEPTKMNSKSVSKMLDSINSKSSNAVFLTKLLGAAIGASYEVGRKKR